MSQLQTSEVQMLSGGDGIPATPINHDPNPIKPMFILIENKMPEINEVNGLTREKSWATWPTPHSRPPTWKFLPYFKL